MPANKNSATKDFFMALFYRDYLTLMVTFVASAA